MIAELCLRFKKYKIVIDKNLMQCYNSCITRDKQIALYKTKENQNIKEKLL